jgi:hypothetical protein
MSKKLLALFLTLLTGLPTVAQQTARMNSGINAQSGNYTMGCADSLKLVTFSAVATATLPGAGACSNGSVFQIKNVGTGIVTIQPPTGTIDGASSITLQPGSAADLYSNGTNYTSQQGIGPSALTAVNPAVAVLAATTGSNITGTYSNGVSGIGATYTVTATGAFTLDGVAINTLGQRVLLKDQSSSFQNGVYTATVVGTTGISPVFTRALDYDQTSDINSTGAIPVQSGTVNSTTSWLLTSTVNTIGTDGLTYAQFSVAPSNIVGPVASGTAAMGTSAINSGACASVVTVSAPGVLTTDTITAAFNSDPSAVTGWGVSATGAVLTIYPYPTSNNVNFKVCNSSSFSITPGSLTINWKVSR